MESRIANKLLKGDNALSLIALAVLFAISAVASPYFLQIQNLLNILKQVSYSGMIGLGMAFVIINIFQEHVLQPNLTVSGGRVLI